jgi:hypothetical protein
VEEAKLRPKLGCGAKGRKKIISRMIMGRDHSEDLGVDGRK